MVEYGRRAPSVESIWSWAHKWKNTKTERSGRGVIFTQQRQIQWWEWRQNKLTYSVIKYSTRWFCVTMRIRPLLTQTIQCISNMNMSDVENLLLCSAHMNMRRNSWTWYDFPEILWSAYVTRTLQMSMICQITNPNLLFSLCRGRWTEPWHYCRMQTLQIWLPTLQSWSN